MNLETTRVNIDLGDRSYDILIGAGLMGRADSYAGVPGNGSAVVVTNETVAPLLAERLMAALRVTFMRVELIQLPDGEGHKNWPTLNLIRVGRH